MKLLTFLLVTLFITQNTCAAPSDDFVIMVVTDNSGVSGAEEFTIPTLGGLTYNYDVDCNNDGSNEITGATGDYTCDYSTLDGAGTYTIRIKTATGTEFPRIYFNGLGDKNKIISVEQWGSNQWVSMNSAFEGAINLTTIPSVAPDLSNATSLAEIFKDASSVNPNTSNWNTSTITSFTGMFQGATNANPNVSGWNTSLVTRFKYMFDGASSANPDTSLWDSTNVLQMEYMFRNATSANPDLTNWNIENVTSIQGMFENVTLTTTTYDNILNTFAAQNVNTSLSFDGGNSKFCAQTAHDTLDIGKSWTITDGGLDPNCPGPLDDFVFEVDTTIAGSTSNTQFEINTAVVFSYNYNVDCDDVNPGTNTTTGQTGNYTCDYASSGVYTIRISDNVGDKTGFPQFNSAIHLDAKKIVNLKQWGTGIWSSMSAAFVTASSMVVTATDIPNLSNVSNMSSMFSGAHLANPNVSSWNTSNVLNMSTMFYHASSATPDISNWDITGITVPHSMSNMLNGISLPRALYDTTLNNFDAQVTASGIIFDAGDSKYCNVVAHDSLINNHGWTITDGGLDPNCPGPADDFVITVKTDNLGLSGDDAFIIPTRPALTYKYDVDCNDDGTYEALDVSGDYTCEYLGLGGPGTYTIRIKSDVSDTFPAIYFNDTGDKDKILTVQQWGKNPWLVMNNAFQGASNLTITATDAPDLSAVSSTFDMFKDAVSVDTDLAGWDVTNINNMNGMFSGVTLSRTNYDAILISFNNQNVIDGVPFVAGNSKYCALLAHQNLIDNAAHNWDILDGGQDLGCPGTLDDFVITVQTDNIGPSADTEFTIPTHPSEIYDYSVDCDNDGINEIVGATGNYTCVYPVASTYTVRIKYNQATNAGFPQIYFNTGGDVKKLITIEQWGTNPWASMASAFSAASNLTTTAADAPDFSNMSSMSNMFKGTSKATPNTSNWNTSEIIYMNSMFFDSDKANPDTSNWNTSKVEHMNYMFNNAVQANPDVSSWNTINVQSMDSMFSGATSANPDVSGWNTVNVRNMGSMFSGATSAIPDISNWDISGITLTQNSMESMLNGISLPRALYDTTLANFDAQVTASGIVFDGGNTKYCNVAAHDSLINNHGWTITDGGLDPNCPDPLDDFVIEVDTTIVGSTSNTQFEINTNGGGYNYNVDCDDANPYTNTATGQTGNYICSYATAGTYTIRISDNIGDKTGFPYILSFNNIDSNKIINLKQWGTGIWSSMSYAFAFTSNMVVTATDVPDLSNVSSLYAMFGNAFLANPDVSNWNTENITEMSGMFSGASSATPDISNWDITGLTVPNSMDSMLNGISLPRTLYDTTLANFDAQISANGIIFDAGNSKYCNVAAHDSLINSHGWTITDGGLDTNCPPVVEDIFSNGFEDVIIFKAQEAQFVYDFSQISANELDQTPLLIAKGLNNQHQPTLLIYLRNDLGQLQIRKDFLDEQNQWVQGLWESIENTKNTLISWTEKKHENTL